MEEYMFFTITNEKEINIIPASYELTSCEIVIKDKYVLLTFCSKEDIQIIYELSPDDQSGSAEQIKKTLENFIKNCISKNYVLKINEYPIRNMVLLSWQNDNVEDAENDKAFDSVEFTWHRCIKETKITGKDNNLHIK